MRREWRMIRTKIQIDDKISRISQYIPRYDGRIRRNVDDHLGQISTAKHMIEITPVQENSVHCAQYRTEAKVWEFGKFDINKMLKMKVMEQADTEWAAQIVIALEKNSSVRFCMDYQEVKAVTERNSYSIPKMHKSEFT